MNKIFQVNCLLNCINRPSFVVNLSLRYFEYGNKSLEKEKNWVASDYAKVWQKRILSIIHKVNRIAEDSYAKNNACVHGIF